MAKLHSYYVHNCESIITLIRVTFGKIAQNLLTEGRDERADFIQHFPEGLFDDQYNIC